MIPWRIALIAFLLCVLWVLFVASLVWFVDWL